MKRRGDGLARYQSGAAAIEFALVASVFFVLLLGAIEMGRMLFYWNATAEATRLGARVAVVCDLSDEQIRSRMVALDPLLSDADIALSYEPAGCNADTCQTVTLAINPGKAIHTVVPFVPLSLVLPPFTTTLTRESLQSVFQGTANPVCQ